MFSPYFFLIFYDSVGNENPKDMLFRCTLVCEILRSDRSLEYIDLMLVDQAQGIFFLFLIFFYVSSVLLFFILFRKH